MKHLPKPRDAKKTLTESNVFKEWQKGRDFFLTHFFCTISDTFKAKTGWEIGFLDSKTQKITVFATTEEGFQEKPADDIFKKDADKVEALNWDDVKIGIDPAVEVFKKNLPKLFPSETLGDGFLILQTFKKETVWNFSFITKTLKFINIKISATDAKCLSHNKIELLAGKDKL